MKHNIPHNYLIHPAGIILYLKRIHETSTRYEFTYKVVYLTEWGLRLLTWYRSHSNNLNLKNPELLNYTFVLKIRLSKIYSHSNKEASFKAFRKKCIKVSSDKLDILFKSKEYCGLPYRWKKNEDIEVTRTK